MTFKEKISFNIAQYLIKIKLHFTKGHNKQYVINKFKDLINSIIRMTYYNHENTNAINVEHIKKHNNIMYYKTKSSLIQRCFVTLLNLLCKYSQSYELLIYLQKELSNIHYWIAIKDLYG